MRGSESMRIVQHTLRELVDGTVDLRDAMSEAALTRYLAHTGRIRLT